MLAVSTQLGWIPSMRSVSRVRLRIRGVEHQAMAGVDEAVSPSPTYRLNRGGDCRANNALYIVVLGRLRYDSRTRAYATRRTAEGLSKPEIIRCLKRYVAREIFTILTARTAGDQPHTAHAMSTAT